MSNDCSNLIVTKHTAISRVGTRFARFLLERYLTQSAEWGQWRVLCGVLRPFSKEISRIPGLLPVLQSDNRKYLPLNHLLMEDSSMSHPACRLEEEKFAVGSRAFPDWECHADSLRSSMRLDAVRTRLRANRCSSCANVG